MEDNGNDQDDDNDDSSSIDSDVLGDPEGADLEESAEACVETYIRRKMYLHFRCLPDLEGSVFPVRFATRNEAFEWFGEESDLNALLVGKRLPVPSSVLDLCQGEMSKYIALGSCLDGSER